MKYSSHKTTADIAHEWDNLADKRSIHLLSGKDETYLSLLLPTILKALIDSNLSRVLDIGCGVGYLAYHLSQLANEVVGVDISSRSIELATRLYTDVANLSFEYCDLIEFADNYEGEPFTCAVSNLSFSSMNNLDGSLQATARLMAKSSRLVLTIPHPCFWPTYWGYANEEWFSYRDELAIERAFLIKGDANNELPSTHFHRPLQQYFNSIFSASFEIESVDELTTVESNGLTSWRNPKFLMIVVSKK